MGGRKQYAWRGWSEVVVVVVERRRERESSQAETDRQTDKSNRASCASCRWQELVCGE